MLKYTFISVPPLSVGLIATSRGIAELILSDTRSIDSEIRRKHPDAEYDPRLLPDVQKQLRQYLVGKGEHFNAPVDLSALTKFQREVLQHCAKIPYGKTTTYGQLARKLGRPRAARAVGGALARNPIPLIIPCHRVIAGDGSLGGFSAPQGISLKKRLLNMESDAS